MASSHPTVHPYLSRNLIPPGHLNLMGTIKKSEVNGPGSRAVVWVQGCSRACGGCFNPASWEFEINQLVPIATVVDLVLSEPSHEGVTFSGGGTVLAGVGPGRGGAAGQSPRAECDVL